MHIVVYMSRQARIKGPNQIYSVVTRVNDSKFIFVDDSIVKIFLNHLKEIKEKLKFKLYGFIIMATHVHLLLESNDEVADVSAIMKHINGGFAQKFNCKYKKKGHFWMERFKSKIVQDMSYVMNTLIYFAMNPVKAGVVDNPLNYKYSSIHNILYKDQYADLLDPIPLELEALIANFLKRENFVAFVQKAINKLQKTAKIFSFNLRKSKKEQVFRNYIGSRNFAKLNMFSSG